MTTSPTRAPLPALDEPIARLRAAKAWVFDMDGVLYRGTEQLPGVAELLDEIVRRGGQYMLATNNSMSTPAEYVGKLAGMNIHVPENCILTSAMATRDYLIGKFEHGSSFHVVGMPALSQQLFLNAPFQPSDAISEVPAGVVVGLDKQFTYEKLRVATAAIRAGAAFIATNSDATLPTETGLVPGCGSLIAALQTASGVEPVIIGKPEPLMMHMALARLGAHADEAVMIGDRLDTDIISGDRAGMLTLLVLTGVSTRDEIAHAKALPDLVFSDLNAVIEALHSSV